VTYPELVGVDAPTNPSRTAEVPSTLSLDQVDIAPDELNFAAGFDIVLAPPGGDEGAGCGSETARAPKVQGARSRLKFGRGVRVEAVEEIPVGALTRPISHGYTADSPGR